MDQALLEVAAGDLQLLIIQLPIQHAKTTYASVYNAAYTLGNWPDKYVVAVSYSDSVVEDKIGRPARGVMERCGPEVFELCVDPRSSSVSRWDILGHTGGFYCATIHKGIAARTIDKLIVDDAVGSAAEVDSQRKRDYIWDKYTDEFRGRIAPGGAEVMIMSRWDPDDLSGRAIRDALERGIPFRVIDMPAICPPADSESLLSEIRRTIARDNNALEPAPMPYHDELGRAPGEALWPEQRPINYLLEKRASMRSIRGGQAKRPARSSNAPGSGTSTSTARAIGFSKRSRAGSRSRALCQSRAASTCSTSTSRSRSRSRRTTSS